MILFFFLIFYKNANVKTRISKFQINILVRLHNYRMAKICLLSKVMYWHRSQRFKIILRLPCHLHYKHIKRSKFIKIICCQKWKWKTMTLWARHMWHNGLVYRSLHSLHTPCLHWYLCCIYAENKNRNLKNCKTNLENKNMSNKKWKKYRVC